MTEGTSREPHQRSWLSPNGRQTATASVDSHGFIQITEEALDDLFRLAGFTTKEIA